MRDGVSANAGAWGTLQPALSQETLQILDGLCFTQMTPVQASAIPQFLTNKDVAVEAVTGSGKTLAFVIPIMEILKRRETKLSKYDVGALILLPTRELAQQVSEVVAKFATIVPDLTCLVAIGGTDTNAEMKQFKADGGQVLVGTPGRVQDLMKRCGSLIGLKGLEVLVLDEADRLLDMGFEAAINMILGQLPKQRRTGLFSATQTQEVEKLVRAGMRNPVRIAVKVEHRSKGGKVSVATPLTLHNSYLVCDYQQKLSQLVAFLNTHREEKCIVYMATCASVEYHALALESLPALKGTTLLPLHGKMVPKRRTLTFDRFKSMAGGILLCTDVAARGLDMPDVAWVLQYDPPQDPAAFVHRCGRTARLGREGSAVVFLAPHEESYVNFMAMRKVPMTQMPCIENACDVIPQIRMAAAKDRALYEKGNLAFVAFVRAYKEHKCNLIFRLKEMDMGQLATAFALLTLPKMPELKHVQVALPPCPVDPNSIPYKDKAREKQRQERLAKEAEGGQKKSSKKFSKEVKTEAWSKQKERKEKKVKRKEAKERKRAYHERMETNGSGKEDANGEESEGEDDWKSLQAEKRLKKKIKLGKAAAQDSDDGGSGLEMAGLSD